MKDDGKIRTDGEVPDAPVPQAGRSGRFKWKTVLYPLGVLAVVAILLLLRRYPPEEYAFWPRCVLYNLTGIYCPGCGNTRALAALIRGDLAECFSKNALLVPLMLCILAAVLSPKLARKTWFAIAVLSVVVLFFVMRNLPWYPFSLLAPH